MASTTAAAPPAASTAAAEGNATANPASTTSGVANPGDSEIESNWDQVIDNFDAMELKPELLRGIYAYGYA